MPHEHLLFEQRKLGRIVPVYAVQVSKRIDEELESLLRLKLRTPNYLNQYDQLFRLTAIWLLVHDYDLTNHQPHQVLKMVCLLNCPNCNVDLMIQQRHRLKKGMNLNENPAGLSELQQCLQYFQTTLQACVPLLKAKMQSEYEARS